MQSGEWTLCKTPSVQGGGAACGIAPDWPWVFLVHSGNIPENFEKGSRSNQTLARFPRLFKAPVDGLTGNPVLSGKSGHPFPAGNPPEDFLDLLGTQDGLSAFVLSLKLRDGDALALPLPDKSPFKLGHCADNMQMQLLKGGAFP